MLRTLHQQFLDNGIETNKTPRKKGVLHKLSRTSKLQARYFKLCDHYLLYYSENVDETNHDKILSRPSGFLDLRDYSKVVRTNSCDTGVNVLPNLGERLYIHIIKGGHCNSGNQTVTSDLERIVLKAADAKEARAWEQILVEVLKQSDQGVGTDVGASEHTKYAPMHIELHAKSTGCSSAAIESFGTPLISPFSIKTIFSNYDFETAMDFSKDRRSSHELSIHFVHTDKDHVQGICKTPFPPSFDSRFDKDDEKNITGANIGGIVAPLILRTNDLCADINKSTSANGPQHKVHISWHRKQTKDRKQTYHAIWFMCFRVAYFFLDLVSVIAMPFLYVNMYLNLLYIDAKYDVTASIATCFGLNAAPVNSFSSNSSALSSLYFGGHELNENFRYINFILFAFYFGLLHAFFVHTVNRLKKCQQPHKYTFLLMTVLISILFWMYATHRLSRYLSMLKNIFRRHHLLKRPIVFVDTNWFKRDGIRNAVNVAVSSIYQLCNEIDSRLFNFMSSTDAKDKENLYYVFGNYSMLGCYQTYNHVLASIYGTLNFIMRDYSSTVANSESEPSAGTFLPDFVMLGFCIISWLSLGLIGIFYSKKEVFYKYTITNIEVMPLLSASQGGDSTQRAIHSSESMEIQNYEKPLIREFLDITGSWAKSFCMQNEHYRISPEYYEDFMAVKFLRARQFQIDKAVALFQQCHQWRMQHNADTLAKTFLPPDKILDYACPIGLYRLLKSREDRLPFHLKDKMGHLTLFYRPGLPHWKKVFKAIDCDENFAMKCVIWILAIAQRDCLEHYRRSGTPPYCTLVFDVGKFSMAKQVPVLAALRMGRMLLKGINLGYPETLYRVVFLQASWIFVKFFDLFKPFIPQNLLKKIQIVTDRKTVLNYLDKTQVPTYFCGVMEDEKDDAFPGAVCDECPMKCGPGRTYWNNEFEKSGWKSR